MNPLIQLKKAAPVFLVALIYLGLLPTMRAVSLVPRFTAAKTTTVASTSSRLKAAATSETHSALVESWKNIGL